MIRKLLIASTLTLGFGVAAAMAQTAPVQPETGAAGPAPQGSLPSSWAGPIGDAFFSDSAAGTLRGEAEIRANWEGLTDEQKAEVRAECVTVDTARSQTDNDDMTTGSVTPDDGAQMAAVEKVCDMVGAM
jgi:predicted Fe-S protein YdhL (DUF1289 family)